MQTSEQAEQVGPGTSLAELLYRFDPIGLAAYGLPADEYEPEAATIMRRLGSAGSIDDVHAIVFEEFSSWFGSDAGDADKYREVARIIWETLCAGGDKC